MMGDNVKDFWERSHVAKELAALSGSKYEGTIESLHLTNYVKYGMTAMELGVGLGYVVKGLHDRGVAVSGLDISDTALVRVSEYCENTYKADNLEALPDDYFDLILSANTIQHIPTDLLEQELKHCIRALKPLGIFAIQFVSSPLGEDTGSDPSVVTIRNGSCCRTPAFMEQLVSNLGGTSELIRSLECDINGVTGCHVIHISK